MTPTPEQRKRRNARKAERMLRRKQRRKAKMEQRRKAARGRSLVRAGYLQRKPGTVSPRHCGKCGKVGHYAPTCQAP